jgi:hypothetical protein
MFVHARAGVEDPSGVRQFRVWACPSSLANRGALLTCGYMSAALIHKCVAMLAT